MLSQASTPGARRSVIIASSPRRGFRELLANAICHWSVHFSRASGRYELRHEYLPSHHRFVRDRGIRVFDAALLRAARSRRRRKPRSRSPKTPAKKPAAAKPEKKPAAKEPAAEEGPVPEDPAVAAILATKPTTPAECVRAAKTLADLGHPDVAKQFLKKVIDAKLDPQQLADLGVEFGVPMFLDLAGRAALLPEAKQLADAVAAATKAKLEDAKRIAELIGQLQDPSAEKRMQALAGLQDVRRAALGPLLAVLADPKRTAEYANVRTVLAGMGRPARDALVAVLDGADPKLKVQAILTLGRNERPEGGDRLALALCIGKERRGGSGGGRRGAEAVDGRVPTRAEAIALLSDAAKTYFDRRQPIEGVADGQVELWRWDEGKRQCVVHSGTPADAARELAARFARAAYALAPGDREIRLLFLTAMLDAAAYRNGLDRPLDEKDPAVAEAKPFGVKLIDEVLAYAMAHGHPAAAAAAARLLGEIGKADELLYQGDKPAPLVRAVQDPDRRLRMAALEAIVRLKPDEAVCRLELRAVGVGLLRGQQRSPPCAGRRPEPRADTRPGRYARGGRLRRPTRPPAARSCFCLATRSPDYELAWIDVSINHPEIDILLQELRRDPRTALLRVGLLAHAGHFELAEHLAALDPMAKAFARPHDEQACRWQLEQLATLGPQEFVAFDVRQRQAAEHRPAGRVEPVGPASSTTCAACRTGVVAWLGVEIAAAETRCSWHCTTRSWPPRRWPCWPIELGRESAGAGGSGQPLHLAAGTAASRGQGLPRKHPANTASCLTTEEIRTAIPPLQ